MPRRPERTDYHLGQRIPLYPSLTLRDLDSAILLYGEARERRAATLLGAEPPSLDTTIRVVLPFVNRPQTGFDFDVTLSCHIEDYPTMKYDPKLLELVVTANRVQIEQVLKGGRAQSERDKREMFEDVLGGNFRRLCMIVESRDKLSGGFPLISPPYIVAYGSIMSLSRADLTEMGPLYERFNRQGGNFEPFTVRRDLEEIRTLHATFHWLGR